MKAFISWMVCMIITLPAQAEEFMDHAQHMSAVNHDSRQLLNYPPDVRTHALANMRAHLQTLADIMEAFANAKYAEAADIADTRLGMDSPGAAGCRPEEMKMDMKMSRVTEADHLNHQMGLLMPEGMRVLGQNMHKSANEFAVKAREAAKDSNNVPAAAIALAKIPQQCVACHDNYRMQ
jgi:hypothetical protein